MTPKGLQDNLDVDYVVKYVFNGKNKAASVKQFQTLIRSLSEVGLITEVRHGDTPTSLFVFVKAQDDQGFADVVYRARIRDWLHGVRQIQPVKETVQTLIQTPLTEAERYRLVHGMITGLREDGGAGITPGHGQWKDVDSIFPLHNHERNKEWLTEFSSKTFLTPTDLDHIRDTVGEKVRLFYLTNTLPAADGLLDRLLLRLPTVLLPISDVPRCFWLLRLGLARQLLWHLRCCEWSVVRCLC